MRERSRWSSSGIGSDATTTRAWAPPTSARVRAGRPLAVCTARPECPRHPSAVPQCAGPRDGAALRQESGDPSPLPDPAATGYGSRLRRGLNTQLRPPWRDDAVRGTGHLHRQGGNQLQDVTLALGVPIVGTFDRQGGTCGSGRPCGCRQLRNAPALHGEVIAGRAAALLIRTACSPRGRNRTKQGAGRSGRRESAEAWQELSRARTDGPTRCSPHRGPPRDATAFVRAATAQSNLDKVDRSPACMPAARR